MLLVVLSPSSGKQPVEHLVGFLVVACFVGIGEGVLDLFRQQSQWPKRWGRWLLLGSLVGLGILLAGIEYLARNH